MVVHLVIANHVYVNQHLIRKDPNIWYDSFAFHFMANFCVQQVQAVLLLLDNRPSPPLHLLKVVLSGNLSAKLLVPLAVIRLSLKQSVDDSKVTCGVHRVSYLLQVQIEVSFSSLSFVESRSTLVSFLTSRTIP